jgi:sugar phosphate isomerase/epimerase
MRFGISTHLFHDRRLDRSHLAQIAEAGFDAIELFSERSHFDYHDAAAVAELSTWLSDTGLALDSIHAPVAPCGRHPVPALSYAAKDEAARQAAVREADRALQVARQIPVGVLVLHLGTAGSSAAAENNRGAALKSTEEICRLAAPLGVKVALEVLPNDLSTPSALVTLLEEDLEAPEAGICMDFGHAHLMGDVADAVEIAAEHVIAAHVHDNKRRSDDHLPPFLGTINWDVALMTLQKIGYEGTYLLELANSGSPASVLEEARRARQRFERTLAYP